MGVKQIVKTTTNRGEFNRAYKKYLEVSKAELHCSYCRFHKGENYTGKSYGEHHKKTLYPNWKLVSKQPKQWMKKPIKMVKKPYGGNQYFFIEHVW